MTGASSSSRGTIRFWFLGASLVTALVLWLAAPSTLAQEAPQVCPDLPDSEVIAADCTELPQSPDEVLALAITRRGLRAGVDDPVPVPFERPDPDSVQAEINALIVANGKPDKSIDLEALFGEGNGADGGAEASEGVADQVNGAESSDIVAEGASGGVDEALAPSGAGGAVATSTAAFTRSAFDDHRGLILVTWISVLGVGLMMFVFGRFRSGPEPAQVLAISDSGQRTRG